MTEAEVMAITNKVFVEAFEIDEKDLTPDARIFEDFGLDSLDTVDLVVALQQEFKVKIRDDERVRSIRTLNDVYQFILTIQQEMIKGE